jgi:hypothetical protein
MLIMPVVEAGQMVVVEVLAPKTSPMDWFIMEVIPEEKIHINSSLMILSLEFSWEGVAVLDMSIMMRLFPVGMVVESYSYDPIIL